MNVAFMVIWTVLYMHAKQCRNSGLRRGCPTPMVASLKRGPKTMQDETRATGE